MGNITIYMHKSVQDICDGLAEMMEKSRSELIEDMVRYIFDEDLEVEVWGDLYTDGMEQIEEGSEEQTSEEED